MYVVAVALTDFSLRTSCLLCMCICVVGGEYSMVSLCLSVVMDVCGVRIGIAGSRNRGSDAPVSACGVE